VPDDGRRGRAGAAGRPPATMAARPVPCLLRLSRGALHHTAAPGPGRVIRDPNHALTCPAGIFSPLCVLSPRAAKQGGAAGRRMPSNARDECRVKPTSDDSPRRRPAARLHRPDEYSIRRRARPAGVGQPRARSAAVGPRRRRTTGTGRASGNVPRIGTADNADKAGRAGRSAYLFD